MYHYWSGVSEVLLWSFCLHCRTSFHNVILVVDVDVILLTKRDVDGTEKAKKYLKT